jgi:hypothetical protein
LIEKSVKSIRIRVPENVRVMKAGVSSFLVCPGNQDIQMLPAEFDKIIIIGLFHFSPRFRLDLEEIFLI